MLYTFLEDMNIKSRRALMISIGCVLIGVIGIVMYIKDPLFFASRSQRARSYLFNSIIEQRKCQECLPMYIDAGYHSAQSEYEYITKCMETKPECALILKEGRRIKGE